VSFVFPATTDVLASVEGERQRPVRVAAPAFPFFRPVFMMTSYTAEANQANAGLPSPLVLRQIEFLGRVRDLMADIAMPKFDRESR
jgi:hypothetical protein